MELNSNMGQLILFILISLSLLFLCVIGVLIDKYCCKKKNTETNTEYASFYEPISIDTKTTLNINSLNSIKEEK